MCWVSSTVITRIISLGASQVRSSEPQHRQSSSRGTSPKFGWNRDEVALLIRKPAISLKWGKIGPTLLLVTNRKLHARFRLVPKSMTLDDLECHYALCFKMHAFSESTAKKSIRIDPYYQRQRCSAMTVVSGGYSRRFLVDEASNDSGVIEKVDFQGFRTLRLRNCIGYEANIIIYYYLVPCRLAANPKIHDLEWPWMVILVKISLLRTALSKKYLHTYRRAIYRIFLLYHMTNIDVRKWTVIRRIFGIGERTADLS